MACLVVLMIQLCSFLASCPVDNGTYYSHTMTDTQRFQLIPFRWVKNYTLVYLHCNVIVCHRDGHSQCSKGCEPSGQRRVRSTGNEEAHRVTLGPIMLRETQQSKSHIRYKGNFKYFVYMNLGRVARGRLTDTNPRLKVVSELYRKVQFLREKITFFGFLWRTLREIDVKTVRQKK